MRTTFCQRWGWRRSRAARVAAGVLAAVAVAACTGESGKAVDQEFVEACLLTGGYEREVCECTAEKAKTELAPKSRAFVVATLTNDEEQLRSLRDQLTMEEALEAGKFMAQAPGLCDYDLQ